MTVNENKMISIVVFLLLPVTFEVAAAQATCACLNGGTFNGNKCVCPAGYVGLYCEQEVAPTEAYVACDSPCENGQCDYTCGKCVCHPFYTGEYCERPLILPCGDYYCFNEGTCQVNATSGKEYCQCAQGYTGDYCLFSNDTCYCLNGGTCATAEGDTTCTCPAGFTGEYCETEICNPGCPTNAYCCNGTCQCYPGYTGDSCTEVDSEVLAWTKCGNYFCFNGGTCQNDTCQCSEGFGGDYCLYTDCANSTNNGALETCGAHVCYYGGTCVNDTCQCPSNTFGVYCEYVKAPIGRPTLILENTMATSATLKWSSPIGYDTIASSGGIWYTIAVENKATRQKRTVTADDTMLSYSMAHSTQYCFTVRAEVSGGSGDYSEEVCFTTPGHESCFCVNGVYNTEMRECICESGYYGAYCSARTEPAHCPAEAEYNSALVHTFNWTETTAGQMGHLPCPCKSTLDITRDIYATRACSEGGKWGDSDDRECSVATVKELCEAQSVCDLLAKVQAAIKGGTLQSGGIAAILTAVELLAKDTCSTQAAASNTLLGAVDSTLSNSDDVLKMTRERTSAATTLVNTLEVIARGALDEVGSGSSWNQSMDNFAVSAAAIRDALTENGYAIMLDDSVRARLSSHVFNDMRCNSSVVISSVINADKKALFGGVVEGETEGRDVVSSIFSVTVGNCTVSGSTEAIEMTFKVPQSAEYSTLGCYYWKTSANSGLGAWSRNGCSKKTQVQRGKVVCSCKHLTTFTVLQGMAGSTTMVYYYIAGAGGAVLLLILLILVAVAVWCCMRRRKHKGAHGFIQNTELPTIPGGANGEAAEKAVGYYEINVNTLDRGNHYDSFNAVPAENPIYAEIGENSSVTEAANLAKEKASPEDGPLDTYDSADGVTASAKDMEGMPIENYECMTPTPAVVYSNTAM